MNTDRGRGGTDDPMDRDLVNRYREASAELNEHPAASARASILAAAARQVHAQPVDATAAYRRRPRWPLAAAAAVLLSTLAVMLAIRTQDEMPQFSPPAEPARGVTEKVAPASPPALEESQRPAVSSVAPPPPPATQEPQREQKVTDEVVSERRNALKRGEPAAPRARQEADGFADRQAEQKPAAPAPANKNAAGAPAAEAPPPLAKTSPGAKSRAEEAEGATRSMDQAAADVRRDAAPAASPAPSTSALGKLKQVDEPAAAWLERIVKLRREGKHDEADAELKRFRERYPQVQVPVEALPATGTR